jgi:crotonobetainyl-CoA:carnitine CoA-transferase CaiB-like acyl-CoA transferase
MDWPLKDHPMAHPQLPDGPLTGIRIIDMTSIGMGPMATQMLGDMGADVIKIETEVGDLFRHVTPQRHHGMSHPYLNLNRNKRSVVLDAKTPEGKQAIVRMAEGGDVFVTNVRPAAMQRLGLDAAALCALNPRLVYCSCVGYATNGPYAGRASLDDVIQAASGAAWYQGLVGSDQPRYTNTAMADKVCALYISNAISMALLARERTGTGQAIEVPMFECMVQFNLLEHLGGLTFVPTEGPPGYARLINPFRKPQKTLDGWIAVVPYTDAQWVRFFELAGRPELGSDPQFQTSVARSRHYEALYAVAAELVASRTTAEWIALLDPADIPYSPVNSANDLLADRHLEATGFWHDVDHPSEGRLKMMGIPLRFSDTPGTIRRLAPGLGEHTQEVLQEIGLGGTDFPVTT